MRVFARGRRRPERRAVKADEGLAAAGDLDAQFGEHVVDLDLRLSDPGLQRQGVASLGAQALLDLGDGLQELANRLLQLPRQLGGGRLVSGRLPDLPFVLESVHQRADGIGPRSQIS